MDHSMQVISADWGLYGQVPPELMVLPAAMAQFSPLSPSGSDLQQLSPQSLNGFVVHAPAGTQERLYTIALILKALKPQGSFLCLARKDRGGTRLVKMLEAFGCPIESIDARRHFRLCWARAPREPQGLERALAEGELQWVEALDGWSQPGVFNWQSVDPASRLLAKRLPDFVGQGADLGCGTGFLSRQLLRSPKVKSLWLIDIDRRAIAAARRNIIDERAHFLWTDLLQTQKALLGQLDFLVSNPPFHFEGVEDRDLGRAFIANAATLLRKNGRLWLVANRHLPYEPVLEKAFSKFTVVEQINGFKVIEAVR